MVLLAGGPNRRLTEAIKRATAAEQHVDSTVAQYKKLLVPAEHEEYVPVSLAKVSGVPILAYWLLVLKYCSRVAPVSENVYIICNECDRSAYVGPGGLLKLLKGL